MAIQLGGEGTGGGANFGNLGALYLQSQALGQQRYVQPRFQGGQPQSMGDSGQGNLTDRDVYQAGAQRQLQSERFQGAAQLNQVELNQAEELRLQRLKAAMAAVDAAGPEGSNQYDAETAQAMKTRLQTGIDSLQERQARAQALRQEQALKQETEMAARAASVQNMNSTLFTQHVRDHTAPSPNGGFVYTDPFGKTHIIPPSRAAAQEETREDRLEQRFLQHAQHIEDSVNRGDPDEPVPAAGWDQAYADRRQERNVRRRSTIDGRLDAMFGHHNVDDYLDARIPGRRERRERGQRIEVQRAIERGGVVTPVGPAPAARAGAAPAAVQHQQEAVSHLLELLGAGRIAPPSHRETEEQRRRRLLATEPVGPGANPVVNEQLRRARAGAVAPPGTPAPQVEALPY